MKWTEYSPPFALHVKGKFTERKVDQDTGMPDPQLIVADCEICKAHWQGSCMTGNVRNWIHKFGLIHIHRDPFATEKKT
jgi:hypothetical protein